MNTFVRDNLDNICKSTRAKNYSKYEGDLVNSAEREVLIVLAVKGIIIFTLCRWNKNEYAYKGCCFQHEILSYVDVFEYLIPS